MFRAIRTRFALSLAVTAIAAMSVVPAYAAPADGPQAPKPQQNQPSVVFQPDLRVNADGGSWGNSDHATVHRFTVTNIGAADSGPIALKGICQYTDPNDDLFNQTVLATVIGGLKSGHSTKVDVVCSLSTHILQDAKLTAGTQNDLDTSNNTAIMDL
jgi:hypothetical protein